MNLREPFPEIGRYTFGTMSVGKDLHAIDADIALVRSAMEAGVWFHTCRRYACVDNYNVLGRAFREAPSQIPRCICKIRTDNADILRFDVEDTVSLLGLQRVDVAQLVQTDKTNRLIADDFLQQGPRWQACCELRERGLIGNLVLEVFFACSGDGLRALESDLFDGFIFYYNLLARELSNDLFHRIEGQGRPILSLRTVGGVLDAPQDPADYRARRQQQLADIYEASACGDWLEFSMRFLCSKPNVITTIGGTSNPAHLQRFLDLAATIEPLPEALVARIDALQDDWMARA
jgi:aryl-alcohol dehydrogenase-like predicted oxidoreductase